MKKFLFIILILFIFISNSEALSKFYLGQRVPNMHIGTISNEMVSHNGVPFIIRRDDGLFVYCLDHQQKINTTDYYNEYHYNNEIFNLTEEQLNKINLLAYYGYGYKNHIDIKWYGVTQFLIWKTLNYRDVFFTDEPYGNRIVAYKDEMNELNMLVEDYSILPSFYNENFNYTMNNSYEIKDLNQVLSNFEIKKSNIESKIENNTLYINTENSGNFEITFIRKSPVDKDYILYEYSGNQPLIYPGKINEIEFKINIEVNSGSITVNNIDSENKIREFASLGGAVYGVYQDEELITTITTDDNGVAYIDNLPLEKYYIKQITPSLGYKLDNNIYEINLNSENKDIVVDSYVEVIKGDLKINKYYGEEKNYKLEDGAIFSLYSINNNLIDTYETYNGLINIELEYGKYYIVQEKGILGYKLEKDKYISIIEEKEYELNFYDEILKGNLIINKYYGEGEDYKLEDGAIFEIYDVNDNLVGSYETKEGIINEKLKYGDYYGIQVDGIKGYSFAPKFNISIKEEKDYIFDLYNKKEELLVVEVPNTKKYDYNKFIYVTFILIGLILTIKSLKETTSN